jgi:ribosomal protein S18 acetylase RimI-like enzyme
VLDSLATDPEAQRRGAGSMLVKWGVDMADSMDNWFSTWASISVLRA